MKGAVVSCQLVPEHGGGRQAVERDTSSYEPVISVIIVVFNRANTIGRAIQSVLSQRNAAFELLVIDGGSTDGTLETIKEFGDRIHFWLSERDRGIADAYNKGARYARGKFVFFLGSDDVLADNQVLSRVEKILDPTLDALVGVVRKSTGGDYHSTIGLKTYFVNTIHHQGAFYNRNLFDSFQYDTSIPVCEDYELNFRLSYQHASVRFCNVVVSIWATDGASSTIRDLRYYKYMFQMRSKYVGGLINRACLAVGLSNMWLKSFLRLFRN